MKGGGAPGGGSIYIYITYIYKYTIVYLGIVNKSG